MSRLSTWVKKEVKFLATIKKQTNKQTKDRSKAPILLPQYMLALHVLQTKPLRCFIFEIYACCANTCDLLGFGQKATCSGLEIDHKLA